MKTSWMAAIGLAACTLPLPAEILNFDLSPAGTPGLSPANEVPAAGGSGSGGELFAGITFDTVTKQLSMPIGYGSFADFTNLTGPATAAHLHGPAPATGTAPPIHDFFASSQHLYAPVPANGGVIAGSFTLNPANEANLLAGQLYINIHTAAHSDGEIRGQLVLTSVTGPRVTCPESVEVECTSHDGAEVELVAHVEDADGDALIVVWTIDGVAEPGFLVPSGGATTAEDVSIIVELDLGEHDISVAVSDGTATEVSCDATITVVDSTPPEITSVEASPDSLWPPNHKMKSVDVTVEAEDACGDVTWEVISVSSNEPDDGTGDGNTTPDWVIVDEDTVHLRAERSGNGDGRIYTITVEATDEFGNTATETVEVMVPHSRGRGDRGGNRGKRGRGKKK